MSNDRQKNKRYAGEQLPAAEMSNQQIGWWKRIESIAVILSAISTVSIALLAAGQLSTMKSTLEFMWEQLRIAQRPNLLLTITSEPNSAPITIFERPGEGGEKWKLPYYVVNVGQQTAYRLRYHHYISDDTTFTTPSDSAIGNRHAANMISPGDLTNCGYDEVYRQQVLDKLEQGKRYVRHLYVTYEDEYRNVYSYRASWENSHYEIGQPPEWSLIAKRDLTDLSKIKKPK